MAKIVEVSGHLPGIPGYVPSAQLIRNLAQLLEADENELANLAGKIPPGLKKMMEGNPLLTELVRVLSKKRLPDEVYRKMIDLARGADENA